MPTLNHDQIKRQVNPWLAPFALAADQGDAHADPTPGAPRKCRVCGCTDDDCRVCIELTGEPCHWVEKDLCSACLEYDYDDDDDIDFLGLDDDDDREDDLDGEEDA